MTDACLERLRRSSLSIRQADAQAIAAGMFDGLGLAILAEKECCGLDAGAILAMGGRYFSVDVTLIFRL